MEERIPELYETEDVPFEEKIIYRRCQIWIFCVFYVSFLVFYGSGIGDVMAVKPILPTDLFSLTITAIIVIVLTLIVSDYRIKRR